MRITLYCENTDDVKWARTLAGSRAEPPNIETGLLEAATSYNAIVAERDDLKHRLESLEKRHAERQYGVDLRLYDAVVVELDEWHARAEVAERARGHIYAELCKQLGISLDPDRPFLKIQDAIGKIWLERDDLSAQLDAARGEIETEKATAVTEWQQRAETAEGNRAYIYSSLSKQLNIPLDPDVPLVRIQDAIGKLIADTVMVDVWAHRAEATLNRMSLLIHPREEEE